MAGMYPENQELSIFGEKVEWPGLDKNGKFTNGSFTDPLDKPSFIPAETLNLILDNLGGLITKLGGTPDNTSATQLAEAVQKHLDSRFIAIFQNGYIQWPGMPAPDTLFNFEGYRWSEVNYNGCFFRAKGKGATPFDGDEQGDAIRNIKGGFVSAVGRVRPEHGHLFYTANAYTAGHGHTGDPNAGYLDFLMDASRVVPTAEENRPRNKTFVVWRLEKI